MNSAHSSIKSFIQVAADNDFPIQNLPFGIFSTNSKDPRCGTAIGEYVVDLAYLQHMNLFSGTVVANTEVFSNNTLNEFMGMGKKARLEVRERLLDLLQDKPSELRDNPEIRKNAIIPMSEVKLHLPIHIGDYTDFYASKHHASNVGTMFRGKENALMPNWLHLPVGYHGRSSSIINSNVDIYRPKGQIFEAGKSSPSLKAVC